MPISGFRALAMWFRKVLVRPLRRALARAESNGLEITVEELEAHSIAGGDAERLVEALVEARRLGGPAELRHLAAFDLAGQDMIEAVRAAARRPDRKLVFSARDH